MRFVVVVVAVACVLLACREKTPSQPAQPSRQETTPEPETATEL